MSCPPSPRAAPPRPTPRGPRRVAPVFAARRLGSLAALSLLALFGAAPLAAGEGQWHVIAKGETLYSVARAYGISAEALQTANGISDPSRLRVGQRLLIPGIHRVAKGETLYGIAREAGTSVAELRRLNGLSDNSLLKVGDILLLPSGAPALADKGGTPVTSPAGGGGGPAGGAGAGKGSAAAASGSQSLPASTMGSPDPKTPAAAAGSADLPCEGKVRYLDGKVYGMAIRSSQGSPVRSVTEGRVVSAGPHRGFGSVVFVQTRSGLIYVYGGNQRLEVKVGDQIHVGQLVGRLGQDAFTGASDAYFFVFRGSKALDPATAPRS